MICAPSETTLRMAGQTLFSQKMKQTDSELWPFEQWQTSRTRLADRRAHRSRKCRAFVRTAANGSLTRSSRTTRNGLISDAVLVRALVGLASRKALALAHKRVSAVANVSCIRSLGTAKPNRSCTARISDAVRS